MNGLDFLDLVIGLIFIFLVYSIAASTLWEIFVNLTHLRAKMLAVWVGETFEKFRSTAKKGERQYGILDHPLIQSLSRGKSSQPTYISSDLFVDVFLDILVSKEVENNPKGPRVNLKIIKQAIEDSKNLDQGLKSVFLQYLGDASGDIQKFRDRIANWYDEAQEALKGSYKKNLQIWIFVISVVLVFTTNADTIKLASYLYSNDDARETIATKATLFVQDSAIYNLVSRYKDMGQIADSAAKKSEVELVDQLNKNVKTLENLNHELRQASIPIGWSFEDLKNYKFLDYLKKFAGLLLSSLAVSMGSPFWFEILSKLSNLRAAGSKPKSSLDTDGPETIAKNGTTGSN